MKTINPSTRDLSAFAQEAVDKKPIVMVNLLRFKEFADYGDHVEKNLTGRQAYGRYSKAVLPLLWEVGGQILWRGDVRNSFIAPKEESWDEVFLVYYPNRQAFINMVKSPAYQQIMSHRTAGTLDSRLLETQSVRLPKAILSVARRVVRLKRWVAPRIN